MFHIEKIWVRLHLRASVLAGHTIFIWNTYIIGICGFSARMLI